MKLLINTGSTHQGGAIQVAWSFITECIHFKEHDYLVILGPKLSEIIDESIFPSNFEFVKLKKRAVQNKWKSIIGSNFNDLEKIFKPDVVFTTTGPSYWKSKAPQLIGFNLPHYVYSESPFFDILSFRQRLEWEIKGYGMKYFFKRDGDAFVCQTDDVCLRVKTFLGVENVYTVSNTYNSVFDSRKSHDNKLLPNNTHGRFRLLLLSAYHLHKNFEIIPQVIDSLRQLGVNNFDFVVTISQLDFKRVFGAIEVPHVINLGSIHIQDCPQLYTEVDALFLPTLLECFSASYPEAMVSSKPILTSDLGFARTVCGDAAIYFDPLNPDEIANQIVKLMNDVNLQNELIKLGRLRLLEFNDSKARAEKFLSICEDLASKSTY